MRYAALLLAFGCPASPPPAPTTPPPVEPALEVTTTCRVSHSEGFVEWTLDSAGLPMKQYENSDAAAHQWSSSWVRDESGRTTTLEIEMLEGLGDPDQTRDMSYELADGAIEASFEANGELVRERWFYDEQGRPSRVARVVGDREPTTRTCTYDGAGRVVARGDERFIYEGDRTVPSSMQIGGMHAPVTAFRDFVFVADPFEPYTHTGETERFVGDCGDVFFYPCSPVFAPPPPGRSRAARLPGSSSVAAPTLEELVRRDLGCTSSDDPEQACTTERVERVQSDSTVREVAIVTIARGEQGHESTHLLLHLQDGWWLGPQLADGPFNGNQMSGTLAFRVSDAALRTVDDEQLALVAHYATQTLREVDEVEHDVEESGWIVCVSLESAHLSCARVAEAIRDVGGDATTEARARLQIPGDGTIAVDEVVGRHERVPRETFPVEWLFQ